MKDNQQPNFPAADGLIDSIALRNGLAPYEGALARADATLDPYTTPRDNIDLVLSFRLLMSELRIRQLTLAWLILEAISASRQERNP